MSKERGLRVVFSCVLLFVGAAAGSWASMSHDIDRPQRTIPDNQGIPDSHSTPNSSSPQSPVPSPQSPLLNFEDLNRPLTRYYIERYSNPSGVRYLNTIIKNGSLYMPFIKAEIAKRGLPPELIYLPFIESNYIGTARSRSGAMGLWQFMMNSIAPFGIQVNDLVDERRDFCKATVAALRKLEENYRALGSWPMALAAYNAGLGAVSRAGKRVHTSDYWVLCDKKELRDETIHYVPKFLAVSYILSNPRKYGLDYWPETTEWTTIKPGKQISLDIIAAEAQVDRDLLRRLNLELLHGITPADKNYELKVPLARAEAIASVLQREDIKLLQYYRYQIRYGDTLSALARHYGISLNLIEQYNPGIQNRHLKIGETIIIPAFKETTPYTGITDAPAQSHNNRAFTETHVVSKGDTLWSLAIRYNVDPQVLARENNMEMNQILSIGKVLKVPIIEERN
ncbi:MAG: LysM peptidoglycan-binding domain-containing protein [Treponema sp.]|nr:LysM peptidoglycan-binding domain-containing protein [Treponema sp.]